MGKERIIVDDAEPKGDPNIKSVLRLKKIRSVLILIVIKSVY